MTASASRWPLRRAATCLAVAVFLGMIGRFWDPIYGFTALIQLDATNDELKISAFREHPVYMHRDTGGYDGEFYAQIAYDPSLRSPELVHALSKENLPYRARRILPSAVAWLLAAGQPAAIVHVFSVLNIALWLFFAVFLWRLLGVNDLRGWLAWAGVLFSAGTLSSVRLALTDLPMVVLLALAVFAAERARPRSAVAWLAAGALARETALLGAVGLITRPWFSWKNIFSGVSVAVPLAAWLVYVRWRVAPADAGWGNFTLPLSGFVEKWSTALADLAYFYDPVIAWATFLAVLGLTVQAVFILSRWRLFADAWWRIGAVYTGLMAVLGTAVWEGYPGACMRVLLPLTLAFNILAQRTRAKVIWLILGNLGLGSGLIVLRDFPTNTHELYAGRGGGVPAVMQIDSGWFGVEHARRHLWAWSSGNARIDIESWSVNPADVDFQFALRSLAPRTVAIGQDGRELWRGAISASEKLQHFRIPLRLTPGHTKIDFSTDTPATREGPDANARDLAFALYDPQLSVPTP
jgi:hypothetical protein